MAGIEELEPQIVPTPEILACLNPKDVDDFVRLTPQLSEMASINRKVVENRLWAAVNAPNGIVLVIRDEEGRIQASVTGIVMHLPIGGTKGWVEDVVTDDQHRGKGYSKTLNAAIEAWLVEKGAEASNLTSNPKREDAGKLYEKIGYKQRDTRVYQKKLGHAALQPETP